MLLISELFLVGDIDLDIIDFLFDTIEKSKILGSIDTLFVTMSISWISYLLSSSLLSNICSSCKE